MKKRAFKGRGPIKYVCFNENCDYTETPSKTKKKTRKPTISVGFPVFPHKILNIFLS